MEGSTRTIPISSEYLACGSCGARNNGKSKGKNETFLWLGLTGESGLGVLAGP